MQKNKKKGSERSKKISSNSYLLKSNGKQTLISTAMYFIIASILTFPLIFRMNSSIYGPYDHITTDLFALIYSYFWWVKESIVHLHILPFNNPLLAAPFETRMTFTNFTGFVQLPLIVLFGHIFTRNFNILFNIAIFMNKI